MFGVNGETARREGTAAGGFVDRTGAKPTHPPHPSRTANSDDFACAASGRLIRSPLIMPTNRQSPPQSFFSGGAAC
jgi:hypothetical protein